MHALLHLPFTNVKINLLYITINTILLTAKKAINYVIGWLR